MQQPVPGDEAMSSRWRFARFLSNNKPFVIVWLALLISIAGIGMVSPLLPKFAENMGASGIWIALAFSGFAFSQVPLMPVVGRLSDRFGKKLFLWLGLFIYVMAAAGYFWAPTYRELVLFRVLSGVGAAMVIPTAYAYVGDLAPRGHEGRYMGLFNIAMIAGFGVGPALGGIVQARFGMHATFASMGILSAAGFIMVLLFLPSRVSSLRVMEVDRPVSSFAFLLKDKSMRGLITFQLVSGLNYGAVLTFLPMFMTTVRSASIAQVGIVLSARSIVSGTLVYPFGWLADRVDRVYLMSLGMIAVATGIFFVPWVGGFAPLLCLFVVIGAFESIAVPAANAITVDRGRSLGMGSVMGVFNMASSSAIVLGSIAGAGIESSVGVNWVFWCAAATGLAGVVGFNVFMRRGVRVSRKPVPVLEASAPSSASTISATTPRKQGH
jgi:MFS family permease